MILLMNSINEIKSNLCFKMQWLDVMLYRNLIDESLSNEFYDKLNDLLGFDLENTNFMEFNDIIQVVKNETDYSRG